MGVKVVPFRYAHLIMMNLRDVDYADCKNQDWLAINSNLTATIMADNKPIAVVGAIRDTDGWVYVWLIGSLDMKQYKKSVIKHLKKLKSIIGLRNNIWCLCRFNWKEANDLLLLLDFEPTNIIHTINDVNYRVFAWVRHGEENERLNILRNRGLSKLKVLGQ